MHAAARAAAGTKNRPAEPLFPVGKLPTRRQWNNRKKASYFPNPSRFGVLSENSFGYAFFLFLGFLIVILKKKLCRHTAENLTKIKKDTIEQIFCYECKSLWIRLMWSFFISSIFIQWYVFLNFQLWYLVLFKC